MKLPSIRSGRAFARVRQAGRTLLELIIAIAIGLVIVAGVSSLYLSSSGVSRTANQVGNVEQAGQLALIFMGETIKQAGYGEIVGTDFVGQGQTLFDGAHVRGCTGQRFVDPLAAPPAAPDLNCTGAVAGDTIYVRYQARPVIAQMDAAEADRLALRDCLAQVAPTETINPAVFRPGAGVARPMVTNVFSYDPAARTLDCQGSGGGAAQPLLRDVVEFRVFYRFDDAAYLAGTSGDSNAAPLGGSVRDAAYINGLSAAAADPWNYVVAALVCMSIRTNEQGVAATTSTTQPRCPATAAEAASGVNLTTTTTDGRVHRVFSKIFTIRARATANPSLS
jgi:type IV pilus assembly protein PilW